MNKGQEIVKLIEELIDAKINDATTRNPQPSDTLRVMDVRHDLVKAINSGIGLGL